MCAPFAAITRERHRFVIKPGIPVYAHTALYYIITGVLSERHDSLFPLISKTLSAMQQLLPPSPPTCNKLIASVSLNGNVTGPVRPPNSHTAAINTPEKKRKNEIKPQH